MKEEKLLSMLEFIDKHNDMLGDELVTKVIKSSLGEIFGPPLNSRLLIEIEEKLRGKHIPCVMRIQDDSIWDLSYYGEQGCNGNPLVSITVYADDTWTMRGSLCDNLKADNDKFSISDIYPIIANNWEGSGKNKLLSVDEYIESIELSEDGTSRIIKTHSFKIAVSIDNKVQCCENFGGFIICEDSYNAFVGKKLRSIELTDTFLITKSLCHFDLYDGIEDSESGPRAFLYDFDGNKTYSFPDIVFVNFKTDAGVLQFAVYNYHNGYYGHDVVVTVNKETVYKTII